jgi:hypothetical protein
MQETHNRDTFNIGVWKRRSSPFGLFDNYSMHCNNYKHDRKRRKSINIGSTHGTRKRQDYGWFLSRSIESKGKFLA